MLPSTANRGFELNDRKDGRVLHLHTHHDLLAAARAFATTDDFATIYRRWRPMVERSLAWLVRGPNRRLRYRGEAPNATGSGGPCAARR